MDPLCIYMCPLSIYMGSVCTYMLKPFGFLQLAFEEAIDVAGALEVEAGLGVAELQEEARGVDGIEGLLHREAALVHQTGDEVFHNLLLHVLEFCLRYVHFLISLSIARWVQKAYWKVGDMNRLEPSVRMALDKGVTINELKEGFSRRGHFS